MIMSAIDAADDVDDVDVDLDSLINELYTKLRVSRNLSEDLHSGLEQLKNSLHPETFQGGMQALQEAKSELEEKNKDLEERLSELEKDKSKIEKRLKEVEDYIIAIPEALEALIGISADVDLRRVMNVAVDNLVRISKSGVADVKRASELPRSADLLAYHLKH
jgi:chromosome segregation ATPase